METCCLLRRVTSGLIAVGNETGLLLTLEILKDSALNILDRTFLDFSEILAIEKDSPFYRRETSHPIILYPNLPSSNSLEGDGVRGEGLDIVIVSFKLPTPNATIKFSCFN